jgi:drug/metabolite transporter (DMT)-like permease
MQKFYHNQLTLVAFVVTVILGGNNAIAVRYSNVELPPFFSAAVRFGVASILLFLVVYALRLPFPRGRSLAGAMIFGALQFGMSYAFIYWSLLEVPAGLFQVVFALVPLLTFFLAIVHRQEAFQWRILVGGLLAVGGIALVFRDQLNANIPLLSLLAIILAAACFAEAAVFFKTVPKSHPITTNAVAMSVGAVILFAISGLSYEVPRWPGIPATWLAVIYLILFGSIVAFVSGLYVLTHWTASAASYQIVLMPFVTVIFASWLANETVTFIFALGGLLVLLGVYIGAIMPPDLLNRVVSRKRKTPEINIPG